MKLASTLLFAFILVGCAGRQASTPHPSKIRYPEPMQPARCELGEAMLTHSDVVAYDGIQIDREVTTGSGGLEIQHIVPAGTLVARDHDQKFVYYYSDSFVAKDFASAIRCEGGLAISKKDPQSVYTFSNVKAARDLVKPPPSYTLVKVPHGTSGLKQELVYNGRTGDTVRILYREYAGDLARPSFFQEMLYDLKESKTIGFKGARVEVINATNTAIEYKVTQGFGGE